MMVEGGVISWACRGMGTGPDGFSSTVSWLAIYGSFGFLWFSSGLVSLWTDVRLTLAVCTLT